MKISQIGSFLGKGIVKIPLIVIGTVVVLMLLVMLLIPTVGKNYFNDHSPEYLGRKAHVSSLYVNLFTGHVELDSLTLFEADARTPFFKIGNLDTDVEMTRLIGGMVDIEYLRLKGLYLHVTQRDTVFNFSDMLQFFASSDSQEEEQPADTTAGIPLIINQIDISNSYLRYQDLVVGSDFKLNDLTLHIPGIDLSKIDASVGVKLDFVDGGSLQTSVLYKNLEQRYDVQLGLRGFNLKSVLPYVQQNINVKSIDGLLDADLHVLGELEHVLNFNVVGQIGVKRFSMFDNWDATVATFDTLSVNVDEVNLTHNRIALGPVMVSNFYSAMTVESDGLDNYTRLVTPQNTPSESAPTSSGKESTGSSSGKEAVGSSATGNNVNNPATGNNVNTPAAENNAKNPAAGDIANNPATENPAGSTPAAAETPFELTIARVIMKNCSFDYTDKTLRVTPFTYHVSDFQMDSPNFDLNGVNHFKSSAVLQNTGILETSYDGRLDEFTNIDLMVRLKNVALKDFSPYSLQMFGCAISGGSVAINSQTRIRNNALRGTNNFVLYKPGVEKKRKDVEPDMKNIPLKLGIYLLTDANGKCELDLPVSGNIDEPTFSYKRALLKVLGQLLVKVATTPLRLGGIGGNNDDGDRLVFASVLSDLSSEDYEKLDRLAATMTEKNSLSAALHVEFDGARAKQEIAEASLRRAYYVSEHPDKAQSQLDLFDLDALKEIDIQQTAVVAFADARMTEQGLTPSSSSAISDKALALYGGDKAEELLRLIADRRLQTSVRYLTQQKGIAASRVTSQSLSLEEGMTARKHAVVIDLEMGEE